MISKHIDEISEKDLQDLIDNDVLELKNIEYKETLPGSKDSDKKEFLADVSSFANAAGGDLIFGIVEDRNTGIPQKLEGLTIKNVDKEISRLESMIRDGIESRISGIVTRPIELSNKKTVIIIRIPYSWNSPHRVSFKGHDKFYSRNTNGKYPMSVSELRQMFSQSKNSAERIKKFQSKRIDKILNEETPIKLTENAKVVLHIIPMAAFDPTTRIDVSFLDKVQSLFLNFSYKSYNSDGFLAYVKSSIQPNSANAYLQVFHNGSIEAVDAFLLSPFNGKHTIPSVAFEREVLKDLQEYLIIQKELGVKPPLFIMLTLIGVAGYTMAVDPLRFRLKKGHPIESDNLLLPEIQINSFDCNLPQVMKSIFNTVWNACGFPRSLNYNEKNE